ncbi:MAG: type I-E CRISPR-associated endoribonuclease Cas2e [Oscillospiraceae bacterium]|nr:type I-E CRISPR-associated endoribonuclease Cas2e [Oscillospiraceae bacterium]
MMVVITLNNCPQKLRGDLSKWLIEINTGVFVGDLNARVRDAVWDRICEHIKNGSASMVFSTNSEQKLDFRIHNSDWEPVNFDGIQLVRRNLNVSNRKNQMSNVEVSHINRSKQRKAASPLDIENYVVIDIETTGLHESDRIIEIGAIRVLNSKVEASFSALIQCDVTIPNEIQKLTGITNEDLLKKGIPIKDALEKFLAFCENYELVGHNIRFDMQFLTRECVQNGFPLIKNKQIDTKKISKGKIDSDFGYGLSALATELGIVYEKRHRALEDCKLTYQIFEKLKEM